MDFFSTKHIGVFEIFEILTKRLLTTSLVSNNSALASIYFVCSGKYAGRVDKDQAAYSKWAYLNVHSEIKKLVSIIIDYGNGNTYMVSIPLILLGNIVMRIGQKKIYRS